ncbi:MAG: DNA-binding response regulator [Pseudopedobacter saltans]|uniref:DNA-binding response regulator n=1 Tax=Pseudopedobacter saltans TaxID=151895 RepID=A0A2W5F2P4_9SPHI|nr:MAG: DNA-binding response regulator [Pseudopedobacter saltans]
MKIRCIAIDDEPWALTLIEKYVKQLPQLELVATFEDAIAGSEFLRKYPVDLLFLDINMPDMNGITLASSLINKPFIVFTTAYKKFAYEGFELEAIDYLLKPFDLDRFQKAVDKVEKAMLAAKLSQKSNDASIFVWSEHQQVKVILSEIMFIESRKDYTCFHLYNKPKLLTLLPLKKTEELLPSQEFVRVHRSYIVPVKEIRKIASRKVVLQSGEELPIGRLYADNVSALVKL